VQGIQYLIQNGVITVPKTTLIDSGSKEIPQWIKNNASWWSSNLISDDEFIHGLQWLISNGILEV